MHSTLQTVQLCCEVRLYYYTKFIMILSRDLDIIIPNTSFPNFILSRIQQYGDDIAIIDNTENFSLTYDEVSMKSKLLATALCRQGVRKGDVVGVVSESTGYYVIISMAVMACGAITSPCNPQYTEGEMESQFQHSEPKYMFCSRTGLEKVQKFKDRLQSIKEVFSVHKNSSVKSIYDLMEEGSLKAYPLPVVINPFTDVGLLPYSSGTTGLPKGVMLSHSNLVAITCLLMQSYRLQRTEKMYVIPPSFHAYGFTTATVNLCSGSTYVVDARFDFIQMLKCIQIHKITILCVVPPVFLLIAKLEELQKYDTTSVTKILCGAAPLAPILVREVEQRLKNSHTIQAYGLTESVPISVSSVLVSPITSVGIIAPNTVVKIVDIETEAELKGSEDGEICVKGPQNMLGYYKNEAATRNTVDKDGWLHTGDIGHVDKNGFLYIVDRLKELIKYKGFQVAPAELESLLLCHPDIVDSAVIGVPDEQAGELPKAFVVRETVNLTEKDIHNFVSGKLSKFKELKGGVTFVEVIPKSASGKILRRELRELSKTIISKL